MSIAADVVDRTLVVTIDSDRLFVPADGDALLQALRSAGVQVRHAMIRSPHGHDSFLIEWQQVREALGQAWALHTGTA